MRLLTQDQDLNAAPRYGPVHRTHGQTAGFRPFQGLAVVERHIGHYKIIVYKELRPRAPCRVPGNFGMSSVYFASKTSDASNSCLSAEISRFAIDMQYIIYNRHTIYYI